MRCITQKVNVYGSKAQALKTASGRNIVKDYFVSSLKSQGGNLGNIDEGTTRLH